MPAWVYLLRCADGSYYVGSTIDLGRRVEQHQTGHGSAYTRRPGRRPVELVWSQRCAHVREAFDYEKQIQNWSRAKREALIDGRIDDLATLGRKDFRPRLPSPTDDVL